MRFLRVAMALRFTAADQLALPWTSFFDDYVSFGAGDECKHLQCTTVESFFRLLGWGVAESGEKAAPFALSFRELIRRLVWRNRMLNASSVDDALCECFSLVGRVSG